MSVRLTESLLLSQTALWSRRLKTSTSCVGEKPLGGRLEEVSAPHRRLFPSCDRKNVILQNLLKALQVQTQQMWGGEASLSERLYLHIKLETLQRSGQMLRQQNRKRHQRLKRRRLTARSALSDRFILESLLLHLPAGWRFLTTPLLIWVCSGLSKMDELLFIVLWFILQFCLYYTRIWWAEEKMPSRTAWWDRKHSDWWCHL